ncbi:helix-turn-helix domain-containing protein [Aquibacillus kalidii]|nr:helix-turn-helix domain-containing protein [Aquibacillus kalidii]
MLKQITFLDRVYLSTLETVCKVLDIDIQELIEVE